MEKRIILHIDVNSAFLSWSALELIEKGSKVDIREIPAVIGGDESMRSGIVLAASIPAKKLGVRTPEPLYSARKKAPGLKVFSPNYNLYMKKSKELLKYFKTLTPSVEQVSVDEAFLDMTGMSYLYKDILKEAYRIKDYIRDAFGYTVNVGIGNNKLTAKMASDFEKPDKVHTLFNEEIEEKMWPLPIEKLYFVGRSSSEKLRKLNINTIGDLAKADSKKLNHYFKNQTMSLIKRANGIDDSLVETSRAKNKSISTTRTLVIDTDDLAILKEILFEQTIEVARQLRKQKLLTTNVAVIFRTKTFEDYSHQKKLDNPTDIDQILYKEILNVFHLGWKKEQLRLIGVRLSNLTNEKVEQVSLFDQVKDNSHGKIQKVIDEMTERFGKEIIKPAKLKEMNKGEINERRTKKKD